MDYKDIVLYEPALMLKELGFDEPCFGNYRKVQVTYAKTGDSSNSLPYLDIMQFTMNYNEHNSEYDASAPTFSQAFRFFREKYNIQGYIYSSTVRGNAEKTKQFTGYIWNINGIDMPFISTDARDELHDTYEEAELACLIKLIELVKTK
jgi:hypothetical protein